MGRYHQATKETPTVLVPVVEAFVKSWMNCYSFIMPLFSDYDPETNSFPQAEEKAKQYITDIETLYDEKETKTNHKTEVSI